MASLFGELGANAIHKIAEANGWKDGSPEKIAMHAALAAVNAEIVKGNITAAAITGGSTEALSNAILKAVGEAKGSSASAQWAAAVIGAALSTATGGDAQSGASIAANAIKNNEYNRKTLAQAKEILESKKELPDGTIEFIVDKEPIRTNPYVDNSIEIIKAEFSDKFIDYASKVVNEYNIDVSKMEGDYTFIGLSAGEIIGGGATLAVDRQKNVYITGTVFWGVSTSPVVVTVGSGYVDSLKEYRNRNDEDASKKYAGAISGPNSSVTINSGIGGTAGYGESGKFLEVNMTPSAGASVNASKAWKIGRLKD